MKLLKYVPLLFIGACTKTEQINLVEVPVYYRLAIYDLDGTVSYSKIVTNRMPEIVSGSRKKKDCDELLPMSLKYLVAQRTGRYILLQWETTMEYQLDKFVVEKSYNAQDFYPVGKLAPKGPNILYTFLN